MANQDKNWKNNFFALSISALIVFILILAGPAQGFVLSLALNNDNPTKGDVVTFTAEIDIENSESLPISELNLRFVGPTNPVCRFYANGSIISGCEGMTITPNFNSAFGYGYGYGYYGYGYNFGYGYAFQQGTLSYTITLDTTNYPASTFQTFLDVLISGNTFTQQGTNLVIKAPVVVPNSNNGGSCYTTWVCSEWTQCTNGQQTRTCEKVEKQCTAGTLPPLQQSCTSLDNLNLPQISENTENNLENENTEQTQDEQPRKGFNRISGALVGVADSPNFIPSLILILGLVCLALSLYFYRKRRPAQLDSFY